MQEQLNDTPSFPARSPGGDAVIDYAIGDSAIGRLLVARSANGVCAVLPGDNDTGLVDNLAEQFRGARLRECNTGLGGVLAAVLRVVDGAAGDAVDLPLDMGGTDFQRRVWAALRTIPPGETVSYGGIAERIGAVRAVRAVARACAANRLAVLVPCHRVVRADGSLAGYRWGAARKRALLAREARR